MTDTVFVYTMGRPGQVGAWSRYVFPWAINAWTHLGNDMYIRHGDTVSKVVDSATTDEVHQAAGSAETFTGATDPASVAGFHVGLAMNDAVLAVAHSTSPYITIFDRDGSTWSQVADPADLPAGVARGVAVSSDGTYVAVAHDTSPYISIYKRDDYGAYNKLSDPASLPAGDCHAVAFSDDDAYLSVAHETTPFLTVYKREDDTFTKLAALPDTHATGYGYKLAFDGAELVVGYATSPFLKVFRQVGDTFAAVTVNGTAINAVPEALALSPSHLVVAMATGVALYERGASYTRLANPTAPSAEPASLGFSDDGSVLLVGMIADPYLTGYTVDGNTYTSFDPGLTLTGTIRSMAFHEDTLVLGWGSSVAPLAFAWGGVEGTSESAYEGVIQWPWLDFGQPGVTKGLLGFDHAGVGTANIEVGYDQSNFSTFTESYAIPADTMPGTMIPMPVSGPSLSVKITYDGGQAWTWYQTTLYLHDAGMGTP